MMNELDKKYQYGWYGTCESGECTPMYFNDMAVRKYIDAVVRVSVSDGMSFEKFTAYDPDNLSWVQSLQGEETFDSYINTLWFYGMWNGIPCSSQRKL